MNARTLALALLAFALGAFVGRLLGSEAPSSEADQEAAKPERGFGEDLVLSHLKRVEAAVQDLRSEGAADAATRSRQLAEPGSSRAEPTARTSMEPGPELAQIREELVALRSALNSLREAIATGKFPQKFPSLEMIRSAPSTQNWQALDELTGLALIGGTVKHEAMQERVRWMSQEEMLTELGRPSRIHSKGMWEYRQEGRRERLFFEFVEDYVANVLVQEE